MSFNIRDGEIIIRAKFDHEIGHLQHFSFLGWKDTERVVVADLSKGLYEATFPEKPDPWFLDVRPSGHLEVYEMYCDLFKAIEHSGNILIAGDPMNVTILPDGVFEVPVWSWRRYQEFPRDTVVGDLIGQRGSETVDSRHYEITLGHLDLLSRGKESVEMAKGGGDGLLFLLDDIGDISVEFSEDSMADFRSAAILTWDSTCIAEDNLLCGYGLGKRWVVVDCGKFRMVSKMEADPHESDSQGAV